MIFGMIVLGYPTHLKKENRLVLTSLFILILVIKLLHDCYVFGVFRSIFIFMTSKKLKRIN